MTKENDHNDESYSREISRRDFLKIAAAASLITGCSPTQQPDAVPTSAPAASLTTAPTSAPTATTEIAATEVVEPTDAPPATPAPTEAVSRSDIIKIYPDGLSRVVRTRHSGVWDGETLVPGAIRQMLDTSIIGLTGLNDAVQAWAALFSPTERIAIKVNTIQGSEVCTHVPLVLAVAESLQDAGVPAEQIVIFDRYTNELERDGYPVNHDGPGVRCYGTDNAYTEGWELVGSSIRLCDILLECDALINMPVLKVHSMAGLSLAMKNHYGTFDTPERYHRGERIQLGIAELNALSPIKDRARLIVGDLLSASLTPRSRSPWWTQDAVGDSILMSFDPVAHDTLGLQILTEMMEASGEGFTSADRLANPWLENGAALGLGTNNLDNVDLVKVDLG
ncbi:MAG: DUF362 domain-containing protein [Chloroflexi bacterium]|nr:DUF362 domain-containing protein [Chloroflexota bacterium]